MKISTRERFHLIEDGEDLAKAFRELKKLRAAVAKAEAQAARRRRPARDCAAKSPRPRSRD
jgi:hypothetical protein